MLPSDTFDDHGGVPLVEEDVEFSTIAAGTGYKIGVVVGRSHLLAHIKTHLSYIALWLEIKNKRMLQRIDK